MLTDMAVGSATHVARTRLTAFALLLFATAVYSKGRGFGPLSKFAVPHLCPPCWARACRTTETVPQGMLPAGCAAASPAKAKNPKQIHIALIFAPNRCLSVYHFSESFN
jgi:hypothetical protein